MAYLFSAQFIFAKENNVIKTPFAIEFTELPRDGYWDIHDALEGFTLQDELRNNEEVGALSDGLYDCFMAGEWTPDEELDFETGKVHDINIIIELKMFAVQPHENKQED